jgi:hypothetical protein
MGRGFVLVFVLVFLTATATILALPASGASAAENTWVELAPMNIARAWLGVAAVNGKIYAIGGSTASGFEPASFPYGNINADHFVGTNEEYNPTDNTWSYKASMPTPRMSFAIAVIQGKIYCMGGRSVAGDMSGGYTSVNEVYDPATNNWENKAPMPIANGWIDAKVIDNRIYIKNYIPSTSSGLYVVYDPASDTWNNSVPSPQDGKLLLDYIPDGYETTGIMSPKMVYTFSDYNPNAKAYDLQSDSWQNGVASPIGRTGFGIALANDIFYVVGGYTYSFLGNFAPLATNEKYIPFDYGTPDPAYLLEITSPKISVLSPLNQTYNESSVPLVFNSDKAINWTSYSLDGQQNITFSGNTNITGISNGFHNVTIYAQDTFGNLGSSQTINFTVAKPEPLLPPESFPVVPVAAVSLVVAVVVAAGLLVYSKKHKTLEKIHF